MQDLVIEVRRLRKDYHGLRPLRLAALDVRRAERVALSGLDSGAAEVFVALLTGATLPDEGEIRILGQSTTSIDGPDAWLAFLEKFGVVNPRAALLDNLSMAQNLAMPFTLEIDPMPPDISTTVSRLASDVGLEPAVQRTRLADASAEQRLRVHLGRAVALDAQILLLDHPTAALPPSGARRFAADVARVARAHGLTVLALTDDERFAAAVAERSLALLPATGALTPRSRRTWWPF